MKNKLFYLDRDLNASKNILREGIKIISSGTDDYRCGDEIRPVLTGKIGESSKKKELVSGNLSVFSR
jgi:transposase